jgi:hypothetical protein
MAVGVLQRELGLTHSTVTMQRLRCTTSADCPVCRLACRWSGSNLEDLVPGQQQDGLAELEGDLLWGVAASPHGALPLGRSSLMSGWIHLRERVSDERCRLPVQRNTLD